MIMLQFGLKYLVFFFHPLGRTIGILPPHNFCTQADMAYQGELQPSMERKNESDMPVLDYRHNRSRIKDGDVLMYRGRSLVSRIVQLATGSKYSHAGIAAWWNERLMVLEAVGKGVVVTPISRNIRSYSGSVEWFTCIDEIPADQRLQMIRFAQRELGKEYALWRAILLGWRVLFQRNLESRDRLRREERLFCSHYVAATYNSIGKDLKKGVSDRFMSPGDIAASPLLKRVGILHKTKERYQTGIADEARSAAR
jgi:hypothetical protein